MDTSRTKYVFSVVKAKFTVKSGNYVSLKNSVHKGFLMMVRITAYNVVKIV
jgi:hypothetical protein